MKKHNIQQKTERRISAALRLVLAVVLLLAQIALVFLLSHLLEKYVVIAYTALELLAIVYAIRVYNRPGSSTYKPGWIVLILALGSMQLLCIGIVGEYVGRTFEQSKNRPVYIAKEIFTYEET